MKPIRVMPPALLAVLALGLRPAGAIKAAPPPKPAIPTVAKFDHKLHAESPKLKKPVVTESSCQSCHPTDKKGTLTKPGKTGHQPCLDSGCHVADFLSVGPATKKKDPDRYKKAAAFCAGCHGDRGGKAPSRYEKPPTDNIFANNPSPNYHVEMAHFEHISKKRKDGSTVGCRDCHVVDTASNALQLDTPGHAQCAQCHGVTTTPMSECADCHDMPGPKVYFAKQRKGSEVRSCGSEGHVAEARRRHKPLEEVSCFKHETKRHRFQEDGSPLECGACHFMFTAKKFWTRHKYDNLKDIAAAPVMEDQKDEAHKMCGRSSACHKREVRMSGSGAKCQLCHSRKTVENEMFD